MRLNGLFSTENYCRPPEPEKPKPPPKNNGNGFQEASKVGNQGVLELLPLIDQEAFQGRFILTDKGNISEFLQRSVGDVLINCKNQKVWSIEIKTEKKTTGNLFLEMWSNRSRLTQGWMYSLKSDILWYYFQDTKILHSIHFPILQKWSFIRRRIYQFPERKQNTYEQLNDTWGACVPIVTIEKEVGLKRFVKGQDFE
jgi:hypothetical protein